MTNKIFEHTDYKTWILERMAEEGRKGLSRKIASHLNIHATYVSKVLKGDKNFSCEQAIKLAKYFELDEAQTAYLVSMVEFARAGSFTLREHYRHRLETQRDHAQRIEGQISESKRLSNQSASRFYESWHVSAIRLLCSISTYQSPEQIGDRIGISIEQTQLLLDFLLEHQLIIKQGDGFRLGPRRTHAAKEDWTSTLHHRNWRLRSVDRLFDRRSDDLFFTSPMTIARGDAPRIRKEVLVLVEKASKIIDRSSSEELYCLNLDFFEV